MVNGVQQGLADIELKLRALDENTAKLIRMEAHIQALTTNLDETNADPIFVQNTVTLKTHRVVVHTGEPMWWSTVCTWYYGRTRHRYVDNYPMDYNLLCPRCLPRERQSLKDLAKSTPE